ncbi:nuclear transport factor 2 family protein [Mycolicibacterium komossense]|uniref:Nuclear transport factor 2 family protein n=1 Tax=Mycolicibacterium komossense TaxID=1779 RepID=A0ABT3CJ14_9MYCO|nr:nuclear transport factor 2 family protein [Mycolicibacterium komossense]MCV7229544.1 nuclear transport factor 2 family protein [Mycolicibacterium komossense]
MTIDLTALEARLRQLEDERDIGRLIASYGPLVDSADADGVAALWDADGSYDVEGWRMNSSADVHAMVSSPSHRELVAAGCCHFLGPTVVTVTGDSAVAVCESLVLLRSRHDSPDRVDGEAWRSAPRDYGVWRATANHFVLHRRDGKWRIAVRTSRLLNGNPGAHTLLTAGVAGRSISGAQ